MTGASDHVGPGLDLDDQGRSDLLALGHQPQLATGSTLIYSSRHWDPVLYKTGSWAGTGLTKLTGANWRHYSGRLRFNDAESQKTYLAPPDVFP